MTPQTGAVELDVVIVNWNAGDTIARCLSSLDAVAPHIPALTVTVVDNASTDGSADRLLATNFDLKIIRNDKNLGFAAACNQGASAGNATRILFLNPDVLVTSSDAVNKTLAFLAEEGNASVGICGIQLLDEDGKIARTLSPFPTPLRVLGWMTALDRIVPKVFQSHFLPVSAHYASHPVDSIMGAFLMIRRPLFSRLGGFSTKFFVYYEDVDLCKRAWDAGSQCWYLADASVIHEGCGTTRNIRATRYFYSTRSRIIYGLRHFSPVTGYLAALGWLVVDPFVRVLYALATISPKSAAETLRGTAMLWADSVNFLGEKRV